MKTREAQQTIEPILLRPGTPASTRDFSLRQSLVGSLLRVIPHSRAFVFRDSRPSVPLGSEMLRCGVVRPSLFSSARIEAASFVRVCGAHSIEPGDISRLSSTYCRRGTASARACASFRLRSLRPNLGSCARLYIAVYAASDDAVNCNFQ